MKRILFLVTIVTMFLYGCKGGNKSSDSKDAAPKAEVTEQQNDAPVIEEPEIEEPEEEKPQAEEGKVYSFGFDGFTNMREGPSFSNKVIGKFMNGPDGATLLEDLGDWLQIEYNGIVGYVPSAFIWEDPTQEYTGEVDVDWLKGAWRCESAFLFIYNNGVFVFEDENSGYAYGIFIMQGNGVRFVPVWEEGYGFRANLDIDKQNAMLGPYVRAAMNGKVSEDYKAERLDYYKVAAQLKSFDDTNLLKGKIGI